MRPVDWCRFSQYESSPFPAAVCAQNSRKNPFKTVIATKSNTNVTQGPSRSVSKYNTRMVRGSLLEKKSGITQNQTSCRSLCTRIVVAGRMHITYKSVPSPGSPPKCLVGARCSGPRDSAPPPGAYTYGSDLSFKPLMSLLWVELRQKWRVSLQILLSTAPKKRAETCGSVFGPVNRHVGSADGHDGAHVIGVCETTSLGMIGKYSSCACAAKRARLSRLNGLVVAEILTVELYGSRVWPR